MGHGEAVLRWKIIALEAYLRKQEKTQINSLYTESNWKKLHTKPKLRERKEIIIIRTEINESLKKHKKDQ